MMFGKNPGTDKTWIRIPKDSIGAELGVWRGDSSVKFLNNAKHIHLVDSWSTIPYENSDEFGNYQAYLDRYSILVKSNNPEDFQKYYDKIYNSVVERFKNSPVTIYRMSTKEWFESFKEKLDWIYVDASHSFEGCYYDLINAVKFIKPGGTFFGDDYGDKKPNVKKAVDKFIADTGYEFNNFHLDQFEVKI